MKNYSKCKNIEATFVDLLGENKTITIPKSRLKQAKKNGLKCDGSSVCFQNKIKNSDMKIYLDKNESYILPNQNVMIFCDTDYEFDARVSLKKLEKKLWQNKLKINIGAELEFFLFDVENIDCSDEMRYFDCNYCKQFDCMNDILNFCESTNIKIEAFHHECGRNQYELDFEYDTPTKTADKIVYLKKIIKYFAKKHKLLACFLPKPAKNESGSGMHINISASWKNKNLFFDKADSLRLSSLAYDVTNCIINHIGAISVFANPTQNSYERLNTGFETPKKIEYSACDRSALIRIPKANKGSARIELRSPDISCNPYLTFLAVIMSGFEFLFAKNVKKQKRINRLPNNLSKAIWHLKRDECLKTIVPKNYAKILSKKQKLIVRH